MSRNAVPTAFSGAGTKLHSALEGTFGRLDRVRSDRSGIASAD